MCHSIDGYILLCVLGSLRRRFTTVANLFDVLGPSLMHVVLGLSRDPPLKS